MQIVPTVVALYRAHRDRIARINAAAIRIEPTIVQAAGKDKYLCAAELAEIDETQKRERKRVAREIAAEKRAAKEASKGRAPIDRVGSAPLFAEIMTEVSGFFSIPTLALKSIRRDGQTAHARQVACYIAYKETGLSFPAIGRFLGNRDHTTILHSVRKIEKLLDKGDENLAVAVMTIKLRVRDRMQARVRHLAAVA